MSQVYPVYAIVVVLIYGWTIYWSLWKLPSWLDFLPLGEIGAIYCYLMVTDLVESLLVLLGVIFISFILPQKWFCDVFVSRGSALATSILIPIMIFEYHFDRPADYYGRFPAYLPWITLVAVVVVFLAGKLHLLRRGFELLSENAVIFIYLSLPLSLVSLLVLLFRNLVKG